MTRPISGRVLEQQLEILAAAELEVDLLERSPGRRVHFRRVGGWLVEERYLLGLLWDKMRGRGRPAPPRLDDRPAWSLLRGLTFSPRVSARSHAKAMFVKTHLRAFYLEPLQFALKIGSPEERAAIQRDVEARTESAGVGAPAILGHRFEGDHPHLCEEWLVGAHPDPVAHAAKVVAFVVGDLWQGYRTSGFEWRSCAESHDLGSLVDRFDVMTQGVDWPSERPARDVLRKGLLAISKDSEALVPWCLGHGDLSVGNMIVVKGEIRLLDWERARRLPLLQELSKILAVIPDSWEPIQSCILSEFEEESTPRMLPLNQQAALASLERLSELRTRFGATSPADVASRRDAIRFETRLTAELDHLSRLGLA